MGRVLCIDWGSKRHGIALSDALRMTARGLQTLERPRTREREFERIAALVREQSVDLVVVGLPLNMDGTPGTHHDEVMAWAKALSAHLRVDCLLVDERRSTMQAEHHLKRVGSGGWKKRKARVDEVAAAVILQSWLDGGARTTAAAEEE